MSEEQETPAAWLKIDRNSFDRVAVMQKPEQFDEKLWKYIPLYFSPFRPNWTDYKQGLKDGRAETNNQNNRNVECNSNQKG